MFSRKNIQSMPCSGTRTGRTLAKRSSSRRMATLAISMFGHGSPFFGVVVGPLRMTWHFLISASTSSGMAFMALTRFSMVRPSMTRSSTLPGLDLIGQEELENGPGVRGDVRPDAVPAARCR